MIFTKRNDVCAGLGSLDRRSHLSVNDCMFSMKDYLSWCCNSDAMRSHRHLTMTIKPRGRKLQNSLHKNRNCTQSMAFPEGRHFVKLLPVPETYADKDLGMGYRIVGMERNKVDSGE